ncbi:MAG: type II toxin-antitoxin system RelE/ParE family toxin [Candidatus Sabulitectum sp.]|nr:type II toxin-antitoxin system RelE/ParE family toxin [Candidatus Sabulitectum sp.]
MRIRILASAIDDLYAGRVFYEKQGEGLGEYFFDSLALYAGIHPIRFGHYRLLSRRFPFAVYYLFEGDVVVIRRVLDLRRNPLQTRRILTYVKP